MEVTYKYYPKLISKQELLDWLHQLLNDAHINYVLVPSNPLVTLVLEWKYEYNKFKKLKTYFGLDNVSEV